MNYMTHFLSEITQEEKPIFLYGAGHIACYLSKLLK